MGVLDSIIGNVFGAFANTGISYAVQSALADKQYKYNSKLMKQQTDWQDFMASTSHQREVLDLHKAGLNPILSVTGGSGAGTPSGGLAPVSQGSVDVGKIDPISAIQLHNETELRKSQQTLNSSQEHKNEKEWDLLDEQAQNEHERYNNIRAERAQIEANIANSTAVSAAQVRNLDAQSAAAIQNAESNAITARASYEDYKLKRSSDYYYKSNMPGYYNSAKEILKNGYDDFSKHHPTAHKFFYRGNYFNYRNGYDLLHSR